MNIYDDFIKRAVGVLEQELGHNLAGVYMIGSLAHGGFSEQYSDIDLAVIVRNSVLDLAGVIEKCRLLDRSWGPRLSVFWGDARFAGGRFPILDQVDFCDHRIVVVEHEKPPSLRPGLPQVRAYLLGHPIDYWREKTEYFSTVHELRREDEKEFVRCLLYPARLVYTWTTGALTSNDDAVTFLAGHEPPGLDLDLVDRGLECRTSGRDPRTLFSERRRLRDQMQACLRWVNS